MNIPLFSSQEIRAIEEAFAKSHPRVSLMQRAGAKVASKATEIAGRKKGANILVLAGPGNNGGDAWVAAELLRKAGQRVTVVPFGSAHSAVDAAKAARGAFLKAKGPVFEKIPDPIDADVIIDGLFGIGLARAPDGASAHAIEAVNASGVPILAIDIPSGLNADTGRALGAVVHAHTTMTFVGAKPGLFTGMARDACGHVEIESLGVAAPLSIGALLKREHVSALIPSRHHDTHKGSYGNAAIIGGAEGMVGAAILAARAALMMGPGKVYAGIAARDVPTYDAINPEIMMRRAEELVEDSAMTAIAIGMGMGTDKTAPRLMTAALSRDIPMVFDADALNLFASNPSIGAAFKAKTAGIQPQSLSFIITPHPGEAARLLGVRNAEVEADRVGAALRIAENYNAIVVLKGSGSIIATPGGHYAINPTGNPGMASGGMGDALAGMMVAFLAQGLPAIDAATLAVYLHGAAADACIEHGMAPHGLTASEVIFEARTLLNAGIQDSHSHG
ncbi:MAG: NAD(P)H-hydrate dehydratase [Betaproteobacteria bacterium]|nr:NAD(P)H-hydrate dehydratase [Betaproteobacteria bacterium]